jgi:hypothetical protein
VNTQAVSAPPSGQPRTAVASPESLLAWPAPNVELTGRRRQDAGPGPQTMYRVPAARAWRPAVGAPVERRVRQRLCIGLSGHALLELEHVRLGRETRGQRS